MTKSTIDDPTEIGWMAGFPPRADKRIYYADGSYYRWPQLRWSFNHIEELVPTRTVWRGSNACQLPTYSTMSFENLIIESRDQGALSWRDMLEASHTDGLLIQHRGNIVFEEYFGACDEHARHIIQSSNKSFIGTLAECLIDDGLLNPDQLIPTLIPELTDSAWHSATVRQLLDMLISLEFHEDYLDPKSDIWRFLRATAMAPPRPEEPVEAISEVLPSIKGDQQHGDAFAYREPNIFVLGWIVRRAGGDNIANQFSKRIWQHLGAEHDAYYMLDSSGAETTCAVTLRDFARFGELIRNRGKVADKQVISATVVNKLTQGGDANLFAKAGLANMDGWSYRSQWWIRHRGSQRCLLARGAHGQLLYIDPASELVIARFGSAEKPPAALLDGVLMPAIDAVTKKLAAL